MVRKVQRIGGFILSMTVLWGCWIGTGFAQSSASCMPSEKEIQKYKEDGTWQQRVEYVKSLNQGSLTQELMEKEVSRERGAPAYSAQAALPTRWQGMQTTGQARILTIGVEFQDVKFADKSYTTQQLKSMVDGSNAEEQFPDAELGQYESLQGYYDRSSYGKLTLMAGDEAYAYTLSKEREVYEGAQTGEQELLKEVLTGLDGEIDYADYDMNEDGCIDGIFINFAGDNSGWGSTWWSHAYSYQDSTATWDGIGAGCYLFLETYDTEGTWGHQTLIHETGHMLGLADYYHASDSDQGVRTSDMMNDNTGDHNGFSKWLLGWIQEDQIVRVTKDSVGEEGTTVNLTALSTEKDELKTGDKLIAVIAPGQEGEVTSIYSQYFVVEYDESGVGNHDGATGHRIFHVDAELDEELYDYRYDNLNALDHSLIQAVSHVTDTGGYNEYFKVGDQLLPDSDESSAFYGGNIMGFTGIALTDFKSRDGDVKAGFHAAFQEKEAVDGTLEFQVDRDRLANTGELVLTSNKPLNYGTNDQEKLYFVDKEGEKVPVWMFFDPSSSRYRLEISCMDSLLWPLQPDTQYTLMIPQGQFQIDEDVFSEECRVSVKTGVFPKVEAQYPYKHDTYGVSSELCSLGNDMSGFVELNETDSQDWKITLHTYKELDELEEVDFLIEPPDQQEQLLVDTLTAVECYDGTLAVAVTAYQEEVENTYRTYIYQLKTDGVVAAGPYRMEDTIEMFPIGSGIKAISITEQSVGTKNGYVLRDRDDTIDSAQSGEMSIYTVDFKSKMVTKGIKEDAASVRVFPLDQNTYAVANVWGDSINLYDEQDNRIQTISLKGLDLLQICTMVKKEDQLAVIYRKQSDEDTSKNRVLPIHIACFDAKGNCVKSEELLQYEVVKEMKEWSIQPASWGYVLMAEEQPYGEATYYFLDESFALISFMEASTTNGASQGKRFTVVEVNQSAKIVAITEPIIAQLQPGDGSSETQTPDNGSDDEKNNRSGKGEKVNTGDTCRPLFRILLAVTSAGMGCIVWRVRKSKQ